MNKLYSTVRNGFSAVIAMGFVALMSPAQATLITVESFWQNGINNNFVVNTTAFFDSAGFTGIGSESFSLTRFELVFDDLRPGNSPVSLLADLTPSDTVTIFFEDGALAVKPYSSGRIGLNPGSNDLILDKNQNRLLRLPQFTSQIVFALQSSAVTFPQMSVVPLPPAGVLFLTGLIGLAALRRMAKMRAQTPAMHT